MVDPTTQAALTTLIAAAISHCEREIAEMNRAVRMPPQCGGAMVLWQLSKAISRQGERDVPSWSEGTRALWATARVGDRTPNGPKGPPFSACVLR